MSINAAAALCHKPSFSSITKPPNRVILSYIRLEVYKVLEIVSQAQKFGILTVLLPRPLQDRSRKLRHHPARILKWKLCLSLISEIASEPITAPDTAR